MAVPALKPMMGSPVLVPQVLQDQTATRKCAALMTHVKMVAHAKILTTGTLVPVCMVTQVQTANQKSNAMMAFVKIAVNA